MAYFIFLTSMRSLQEFRKNPHIKIPPKSPCTNFQSFGEFKNPIFYSKKIFSSDFSPVGPATPPACLAFLAQLVQPAFFSLPVLNRAGDTGLSPPPLAAPASPTMEPLPHLSTSSPSCPLHSMDYTSFKCEPFHPH
jgi:hypothetical protein